VLCIEVLFPQLHHTRTSQAGINHWYTYPFPDLHRIEDFISCTYSSSIVVPQWLKVLLFFALRRAKVILPFLVRILLKNPCRLFLTKWLGLNVFLGPHRICVAPRAGCAEILGRRSSVSADAWEAVEGEHLNATDEGNTVGRDGPRKDVKALLYIRSVNSRE